MTPSNWIHGPTDAEFERGLLDLLNPQRRAPELTPHVEGCSVDDPHRSFPSWDRGEVVRDERLPFGVEADVVLMLGYIDRDLGLDVTSSIRAVEDNAPISRRLRRASDRERGDGLAVRIGDCEDKINGISRRRP